MGCPYSAVGMQRASHSAIGFPNNSTSASWMLAFLMPADVRRSFKLPPEFVGVGENVLGADGSHAVETGWPAGRVRSRFRPDPASLLRGHCRPLAHDSPRSGLLLLEPVARLAEGALGEREHLGGVHREHENCACPSLVPEAASWTS